MKQFLFTIIASTVLSCNDQNNLMMEKQNEKKIGTIEVVVFKTKSAYSKEQVIEAAKAVNPVVQEYDGFIGRKLAIGEDGTWTDIVYWTDLQTAEIAAKEVMKSTSCQKFFAMIEEEGMQFMHLDPVIDTEH